MINRNYLVGVAVVFVVALVYLNNSEQNKPESDVKLHELQSDKPFAIAERQKVADVSANVITAEHGALKAFEQTQFEKNNAFRDTKDKEQIVDPNNEINEPSSVVIEKNANSNKAFIERMDVELKQAARDRNWTTLELLADEVEQQLPKRGYNFALDLAIRMNAPFYVIENLVAKGGRFNYRHVISMAKFNRHELYVGLQSLGLNVHLKTPDGKNALYYAMEGFKEKFVFTMLLADGVDANVEYKGKRLVDICFDKLLNSQLYNDSNKDRPYWGAVRSFRQLVRFGNAELLPRHLSLLNKIRSTRPQTFDLMTKELPNKAELLNRLDEHQYVDQES